MITIDDIHHCRCTVEPAECRYCGHQHHVHNAGEEPRFCLRCGHPFGMLVNDWVKAVEVGVDFIRDMIRRPRISWKDILLPP